MAVSDRLVSSPEDTKIIDFTGVRKFREARANFAPLLKPRSQPFDNINEIADNKPMTEITIELLDAKLEAAEARTEARVVRLETLVENSITNNERAIAEFREENKHTRRTIIITAVTSVIAIVLGIAAFNATLFSNMMNSYDLGQNSRDSINTEVSNQTQPLAARLDRTEIKLDRIANAIEQLTGSQYPKDPKK